MASIVNGFTTPLKQEHILFLSNVLLPLHKVATVGGFHHQLSYCTVQYIAKASSLFGTFLAGISRWWPWRGPSQRHLLFLDEIEDAMDKAGAESVAEQAEACRSVIIMTVIVCLFVCFVCLSF